MNIDNVTRWNFDSSADLGISVCKGDHEKGECCVYEILTPEETKNLIEALVSKIAALQNPTKISYFEDLDKLPDGFYELRNHEGKEECLVRLYSYELFEGKPTVRVLGFGVWDGAGLMPIADLNSGSSLTPLNLKLES